MKVQRIESGGRRGFLADVELTEANQRILDEAMAEAGGAPTWRSRKHAEARDLLALSQRAERFDVLGLDMRETLRVMAGMAVTVPRLEAPDAELIVEKQAVLGIRYFEEAIREVPEVIECYLMTGEFDYLLRVVVSDAADFERVHSQHLTRLPGVARVQSSFALRTVRKSSVLPIR